MHYNAEGEKNMQLNPRQRDILAEKLADLGNVTAGSLVFGYVLRSDAFNGLSLIIGLTIGFIGYFLAITLQK